MGEGVPVTPVIQIAGDPSTLDFAGVSIQKTSTYKNLPNQKL